MAEFYGAIEYICSEFPSLVSGYHLVSYLVGVTMLLFGLLLGFLLSSFCDSIFIHKIHNRIRDIEKLLFKFDSDTKPE